MDCPSALAMGAFTVALVITDLLVWRGNRVVKHGFLGGIVTLLFFTLCQRGYEMVNWSLLGLFLLFLVMPFFVHNEPCTRCGMEADMCEC
jgi:hypothetical protein